jgi:hypothetical protein
VEDLADLTQHLESMELQKTEKSIDEGMQLQNVLRKEELLVKEAEELNPKELIISKKSSPEDLPSTALTANGVIHVDQLYKIPLMIWPSWIF